MLKILQHTALFSLAGLAFSTSAAWAELANSDFEAAAPATKGLARDTPASWTNFSTGQNYVVVGSTLAGITKAQGGN